MSILPSLKRYKEEPMAKNTDILTAKQLEFVNKYMETLNATRAYMALHPKTTYDSARACASRLLADENIRTEINRRIAEHTLTSGDVLTRLTAIANAPLDAIDTRDSLRALELLGKYHALFTEKVEQTEKKVIHVTIGKSD
jgi:phage terminase small subunit